MPDHNAEPDHDELVERLPTPGWKLESGNGAPVQGRTLEELVRLAHAQRAKGEPAGVIKHLETELELDLLQLEKLWMYLGLPR